MYQWKLGCQREESLYYLRSPVVMLFCRRHSTLPQNGSVTIVTPSGHLNIDFHVIVDILESKSSPPRPPLRLFVAMTLTMPSHEASQLYVQHVYIISMTDFPIKDTLPFPLVILTGHLPRLPEP